MFINISLMVSHFNAFPSALRLFKISNRPMSKASNRGRRAAYNVRRRLFVTRNIIFQVSRSNPLSTRRVVRPLIVRNVGLRPSAFFFIRRYRQMTRCVFRPNVNTLLLGIRHNNRYVTITSTSDHVPRPFHLTTRVFQQTTNIRRLMKNVSTRIRRECVVCQELKPTSVFRRIRARFFPRIVMMPIPTRQRNRVRSSFFRRRVQAFRRIRRRLIPITTRSKFRSQRINHRGPPRTKGVRRFHVSQSVNCPLYVRP